MTGLLQELSGSAAEPDRECLGRVAAYATHTGIAEFRMFVCHDPPFTVPQFDQYLRHHGRQLILPDEGWKPRDHDALVLANTSENKWLHSLFWDAARQSLLDCQPEGIHVVVESKFKIKCWIPITKSA